MDLVAGVRKEGSRGGRAEFKWEDVRNDQHRENYLGHSLMAPVGRWQKNRDLSWYAKGDESEAAKSAADARKVEIRRIKEAEQDALSEALGYPVMPKPKPLDKAEAADVERVIKETADEEDEDVKGVEWKKEEVSKVYPGSRHQKTGENEMEAEIVRGTGGGGVGAETVTDVADIEGKMTRGGILLGIDRYHVGGIGVIGKIHGQEILIGDETAIDFTIPGEIAAFLHDAGKDPGKDRRTWATTDDDKRPI